MNNKQALANAMGVNSQEITIDSENYSVIYKNQMYTVNDDGRISQTSKVTISFNTNNEESPNEILNSITAYPNTTITLPTAPTRNGYFFNGWYESAVSGNRVYGRSETSGIMPPSTTTLYAQWREEFLEEPLQVDKYGYKVNGYTATNYNGVWRLFYQDNEDTYIIADPSTTAFKPWDYCSKFLGKQDLSVEGQNLNSKWKSSSFYTENGERSNMKALSWLTDTNTNSIWTSTYKDSGNNPLASYAIAGPTMELYYASFKATHVNVNPNLEIKRYGYSWDGYAGPTAGSNITGDYHGIYNFSASGDQSKWWLASPSATDYFGNGTYLWYLNGTDGKIDAASVNR